MECVYRGGEAELFCVEEASRGGDPIWVHGVWVWISGGEGQGLFVQGAVRGVLGSEGDGLYSGQIPEISKAVPDQNEKCDSRYRCSQNCDVVIVCISFNCAMNT